MRALGGALTLVLLTAALACGDAEAPPQTASAPVPGLAPEAEAAPVPETQASGNRAPVIESLVLHPESPQPGGQVVARIEARDADGDALRLEHHWQVDGRRMQETGPFLVVPDAPRDALIELSVVASDDVEESPPATATARVGNTPPAIRELAMDPSGEVGSGQDLEARPVAEDRDDDPIRYRYRWTRNGRELAEEGATLRADHYDRGDTIVVVVVANDGIEDGEPFESEPVDVVNAPPEITSVPGAIGKDGMFRYQVEASDPDGDSRFDYRLLSGPDGMTIAEDEGLLRWRPGQDAAGTHEVELEVADSYGGRATQHFEVRLSYTDAAPPASDDESVDDAEDAPEDDAEE